jgi:hypothetical protein
MRGALEAATSATCAVLMAGTLLVQTERGVNPASSAIFSAFFKESS